MLHRKLILASASPRRKELMEDIWFPFTIACAEIEEVLQKDIPVEKAIEQIALSKAQNVFLRNPEAIVLGCDTVVCYGKEVLGKPKDKDDAYRMLKMLSGKTHRVISAVALLQKGHCDVFHDVSEVTFYDLDDDLISYYLSLDEPYDKAGSYGIQGKGKLLVKELRGDYFSVMGLPVAKVYRLLKKYEK